MNPDFSVCYVKSIKYYFNVELTNTIIISLLSNNTFERKFKNEFFFNNKKKKQIDNFLKKTVQIDFF